MAGHLAVSRPSRFARRNGKSVLETARIVHIAALYAACLARRHARRRDTLAAKVIMRTRWIPLAATALAAVLFLMCGPHRVPVLHAQAGAPAARTAVAITFGELQERVTDYSGTLSLSEGRVAALIPWRFFGGDQLQGADGWKLETRVASMENQPDKPIPLATSGNSRNVVPKGVTAVLDAPATASATIRTARGTYTFRLEDLKGGRVATFEGGDVTVQATAAPVRVSPARPSDKVVQENDFPSLAIAADGSAWVAWQVYEPGGDRVLVAHSTAYGWSAPEALTAGGQDVFRTAIGAGCPRAGSGWCGRRAFG